MKRQDRPIAGLLVGSLLLALVVALGAGARSDSTPADGDVIALVEGVEVTWGDWQFVRDSNRVSAIFRERLVSGDLDLPEEVEHLRVELEEVYDRWDRLHERYAADVPIAARIVLDGAVRAAARDADALPSDPEVSEHVSRNRELLEEMLVSESPSLALLRLNHEANVRVHGEDAYWDEVAPRTARVSLAMERLLRSADRSPADWNALQFELALSAEVTWTPDAPRSLDLGEVRAYLGEARDFISEHGRTLANQMSQ